MNITSFMKKERSGLAFTTLEFVKAAEQLGHGVCLREPSDAEGNAGTVLYGNSELVPDLETIHSQMPFSSYFNGVPKFLFAHGEPLSSVGNGISMKAMVDMAPKVDAIIAMREEEARIWRSIKRTYVVPKGIDLERFHPLDIPAHVAGDETTKLSGDPAILYCEHWRGQRNPLYWCVAMEEVLKRFPKAHLHLYNCPGGKMYDTFRTLINANKWWLFVRSLKGAVADTEINRLYARADIVVSGLFPLYARSIECFGAGKAFIGPGYTNKEYPWHCEYHPDSMARAIVDCWEDYHRINYRQWAETKHDVKEMTRQILEIASGYQRRAA